MAAVTELHTTAAMGTHIRTTAVTPTLTTATTPTAAVRHRRARACVLLCRSQLFLFFIFGRSFFYLGLFLCRSRYLTQMRARVHCAVEYGGTRIL